MNYDDWKSTNLADRNPEHPSSVTREAEHVPGGGGACPDCDAGEGEQHKPDCTRPTTEPPPAHESSGDATGEP